MFINIPILLLSGREHQAEAVGSCKSQRDTTESVITIKMQTIAAIAQSAITTRELKERKTLTNKKQKEYPFAHKN